jgi:hypothetical protein
MLWMIDLPHFFNFFEIIVYCKIRDFFLFVTLDEIEERLFHAINKHRFSSSWRKGKFFTEIT